MKLKKFLITLSIFLFLVVIATSSIAMTYFENVGTNTGIVTTTALNVRTGPRNYV